MPCTVEIRYRRKFYVPGELITGYIVLHVEDVFAIESILLMIDKRSRIRVEHRKHGLGEPGELRGGAGKEVAEDHAERHLGKFVLYEDRERKKVVGGTYQFPFSFRMMKGEGATIHYSRAGGDKTIHIINRYITRCEVRIYGIYKPVATSVREVNLVEDVGTSVASPQGGHAAGGAIEDMQAERRGGKVFIREKYGVISCFCARTGSIDIEVEMDRVLYAGRRHTMRVRVRKGSEELAVARVNASLEMAVESEIQREVIRSVISPEGNAACGEGQFVFSIEESLPSATVRNDLFSIRYYLEVNISIAEEGAITVKREVSLRNKNSYGERALVENETRFIYPERHLALLC